MVRLTPGLPQDSEEGPRIPRGTFLGNPQGDTRDLRRRGLAQSHTPSHTHTPIRPEGPLPLLEEKEKLPWDWGGPVAGWAWSDSSKTPGRSGLGRVLSWGVGEEGQKYPFCSV